MSSGGLTMEMLSNWRVLIGIYILLAGVWGVLIKAASDRLEPFTTAFIALSSCWLTVTLFSAWRLNLDSGLGVLTAALCGVLAGVSAIAFYGALKLAPASVIIPVSSLYIIVTIVLSIVFLGEVLTLKRLAGIVFGLAAIILLTV